MQAPPATTPARESGHAVQIRPPLLPRLPRRKIARRRAPRSVAAPAIAWIAGAVALLAVWVTVYALLLSGLQERHAQSNDYAKFREQLASQTAPIGGLIEPDSPVALISAPELGLHDTVVVEGTASNNLERGPGHKRDTVLPGQPGTSVIYGRAALFGAVFGTVGQAHPGDRLTVTTGQGVFRYVVEDVRRPGDHFPAALTGGGSRLTLVTSEGGSLSNLWTPQRALYVDAKLQGRTQPTPGPTLAAVPAAERAMSTDRSTLTSLVLWLALLVIVALTAVWATARWGRWQTWIVGVPALTGVLWGASAAAVAFLPNLM